MKSVLTPDSIVLGLKPNSRKQLIQDLSREAARVSGLSEDVIRTALDHDDDGDTVPAEGGVAVLYESVFGLSHVKGTLLLLDAPVQLETVDRMPVDIVLLLISPRDRNPEYLQILSRMTRSLRAEGIAKKLRGVESAEAAYALISGISQAA